MSRSIASPGAGGAVELSAAQARATALAAQGFDRPRPTGRVDARQLRRVLGDVGLLQIDSVNVLSRAHYLPLFSRLGPSPRETLDRLTHHEPAGTRGGRRDGPAKRELFEYWAHEASLVPVELQPLLRWRMARVDDLAWGSIARVGRDRPDLVEWLLEQVRERGPIRASELAVPTRRSGEMWSWTEEKKALEHLFFVGRIAAARRVNFERLYDLAERVLPADVLAAPTPPEDEAQRQLVLRSARHLGVATEPDLGDYFRLPRAESKLRVAELVEAGDLLPAQVEGWGREAYVPADLQPRSRLGGRAALLSPFDSLIWRRERAERLFGFRYRIEIYTPAAKRQFGYYVLPFLLGDRLVARVDLKSDRAAGVLRVQGAFAEPGVEVGAVAEALIAELRAMSGWLGLGEVAVVRRGDLARPLAQALAAPAP
jgi:uncharacterized protein YcaQ